MPAGSCHIRTSSQIDAAYVAYKLYSEGSIEAQLLQGTLRFGLITELRNHIEQNS